MALVLADYNIRSTFDGLVLAKLLNYTKPIKTKHLAKRLNADRDHVTSILNYLRQQNLVRYNTPKKTDEKKFYGWIAVRRCKKCGMELIKK